MNELYRIMIVDDERIVREAIAYHIAWETYGVLVEKVAANAVEALEYLEKYTVDLMLVDIRMPVMDGIELLKRVRAAGRETACIILSGYADFSYAQEALRFGAKDYLLKPLEETVLVEAVLKCRDEKRKNQFLDQLQFLQGAGGPGTGNVPSPAGDKRRFSNTVNHIIAIVEEEIANEDLNLKWISQQKLFLNENYLGKIFQKEVKQKFSAYLLERRKLLAMHMLAGEGDLLVADVAAATGFGNNPGYFASTFKKYTGYTPTEYKKKLRENA